MMAHRVLETGKTRVVPVVDLAFVIDHCKELVIVQCLWTWITAPVTGKRGGKHLTGGCLSDFIGNNLRAIAIEGRRRVRCHIYRYGYTYGGVNLVCL